MTDIKIRFNCDRDAETALRGAGFSIGSMQRGDARGILFGDYLIAKWRNLTARERAELHGRLCRHGGPDAPVTVTIRAESVPPDALAAVKIAGADYVPPVELGGAA